VIIPDEPGHVIEHDFRMTPTRISARRIGASWIVFEAIPLFAFIGDEKILAFRGDWRDAFLAGVRLVECLAGRTVAEAEAEGLLT
jgi:hypothetical protein